MNLAVVGSALLMGLLGSTHCAVMCGGVVSVLSGGLVQLGTKKSASSPAIQLAMSLGRVTMYALFGAALGGLGSMLDRFEALRAAQVALRLGAGVLMVLVGLYMSGAFTKLRAIEKVGLPVWRKVEPLAKRLLPVRTVPAAFALGLTWGFMPCGLVYGALGLAVATGKTSDGAATMLAFGLGTLPMMLAVGAFSRLVAKLAAALWVRRAAGLAIVFFGAVNVATATAQAGVADVPGASTCCATKN